MTNLAEKVTNYLKSKNLRYLINEDESNITLPYVYNNERIRIVIFIHLDDENKEIEMGFTCKASDDLKLEEALSEMLILNSQLRTGKIGLCDEETMKFVFSIRFTLGDDDEFTDELYSEKLRLCFAAHSILIERKIIKKVVSDEKN